MKKKLNIIYEDKHLLVVSKPAKLLCVSTPKEKERTLYHEVYTYLKQKNKQNNPLEIVGIKYLDDTSSIYNYNNYIYASDKILDKLKYQTYQAFSTTTVNLAGHNHNDLNIAVNTNVPKGHRHYQNLRCLPHW